MNDEQLKLFGEIKNEIEKLNVRRLNKKTREDYTRRVLKFAKILIENDIKISAFRNLNNNHLMEYGKVELSKNRSINAIMKDITAVRFFFEFQQYSHRIGKSRKLYLLDNKVLKKYFENLGGEE